MIKTSPQKQHYYH